TDTPAPPRFGARASRQGLPMSGDRQRWPVGRKGRPRSHDGSRRHRVTSSVRAGQRVPIAVLAAALLFNLGQGVLRPSMPLYLQRTFAANYRMVTLIPVVFGAGKWVASLPTGYLLSRFGRPLMIGGLLLIAFIDLASVTTSSF